MEAGTQTTTLPRTSLPATRFRTLALLLVICGASAGVHATLIPEHLREEPPLGVAFVLAVALLAAVAAGVVALPESELPGSLASLLLAGLIVSYAATRTIQLPGLKDTPEPADGVGLATSLIEAVGVVCGLALSRRRHKIMRHSSALSRRSLWLPGAALLAALLTALALSVGPGGAQTAMHPSAKTGITQAQQTFRMDMRKLWEDHITWTRMAIVDFAANAPSLKLTEQRLLRNQTDIGNAVAQFYGRAAGNRLTALLRQHILEAVDVLVAAKSGDKAKLDAAEKTWYANADQIAGFLTKANPTAWPLSMTKAMMKKHLDLTNQEAVARLTGKWAADIRAYDAVHAEILQMADMLSNGIIQQFPQRFAG